jgi:hypothetical protein
LGNFVSMMNRGGFSGKFVNQQGADGVCCEDETQRVRITEWRLWEILLPPGTEFLRSGNCWWGRASTHNEAELYSF